MRTINTHKVNPVNDTIEIQVLDEPGAGGANHHYHVGVPFKHPVESYPTENSKITRTHLDIRFQNGPIAEVGVNGITQEVLLAICIDRLQGFQSGPYASEANAMALAGLESALFWLQKRTRERMERGVEDTNQK